ncbi:MAG: hypothetical protein IJ806_07725 [Ruminococcus sp.]|nr:hypothetical protein [Ruminococcus sp.]
MKINKLSVLMAAALLCGAMAACGQTGDGSGSSGEVSHSEVNAEEKVSENEEESAAVTEEPKDEDEPGESLATAPVEEVGFEGMEAVEGDKLNDGTYEINAESSSSMFRIERCLLTVSGGDLSAELFMSGKGYRYLFMGTSEEAQAAGEDSFIGFEEKDGTHTFTVPVEALDSEIDCAAFSDRKEAWYDRTLVFRADSLPGEAFKEGRGQSAGDLGLADGTYSVGVTLEGGSGKASVMSPARLTVSGGEVSARLVWSSDKYDYMIVDGERYDAVIEDGASCFEVPVKAFGTPLTVLADTTAMSVPHEIEYRLTFDPDSIEQAGEQ